MPGKVIGRKKLRQKMQALPTRARKEMHLALKNNAQELVTRQKSLIPVRTGMTRRDIHYDFLEPTRVVVRGGKPGRRSAFVARLLEGGTRPGVRRVRKGKKGFLGIYKSINHPGTKKGRGFFFSPWRNMKRRHKGRLTRSITRAAKAIARR